MLELRRARMEATAPFLRGGFRPFFFGGALWAILALAIWLLALIGFVTIPSNFGALAWHRHEMLFGFAGAVITGFLLTAIPNWTGRLPIAGPPLAALFALWVLGRVSVLFSALAPPAAATVIDAGFYLLVAMIAGREVLQAGNNRNLPLVAMVLLLGVANLLDHLSAGGALPDSEIGWKVALAIITLMISVVGGRIVPSFTRNWLAKQGVSKGLPTQPNRFDTAVLIVAALALLAWITAPAGRPTGLLFALAGGLQFVRLGRWKGWKTLRDPLVFILHLGYAWIPVGLGLFAAVSFGSSVPQSAAVHALTAGAMSTMILAVMTRATLGHTGRDLVAGPLTWLCYILVTIGALLRVTSSLGWVAFGSSMEIAGLFWIGAFTIFLFGYAPMLLSPRIEGR
jgi:uncharacterized protein involved in response to NO